MLCRFCLRHAWGQCLKEKKIRNEEKKIIRNEEKKIIRDVEWPEPLYLVLGDGRRFRLEFDCKRCEMKVLRS